MTTQETVTLTLTKQQVDDLGRALETAIDDLQQRQQRLRDNGRDPIHSVDFEQRLWVIDMVLRGHPNQALVG